MPLRSHFYHTVIRRNPITGDIEPLENVQATPFEVGPAGVETSTEGVYYASRTGAVIGDNISDENGVVQFYLDNGDYNVHMTDLEVSPRIEEFVIAVNSVSYHDINTLHDDFVYLSSIKEPRATFVTSLPISPVDGQVVFYRPPVADTSVATAVTGSTTVTQAAVLWHLRWVEGAFGSVDDGPTGRWMFLGGGRISRNALFVNDIGSGSGATPALSTWYVQNACAIQPPLPGFYELTVGARNISNAGVGHVSSASIKAVRGSGSTWTTSSGWPGAPSMSFKTVNALVTEPISLTRDVDLSDLASGEQLAVAMNSAGPDILSVADAYLRLRPIWVVPF